MARTITIDGVDRTAITRLGSFSLQESAHQGEVANGGLDLDDATAAITIPALKAVTVVESASVPTRMFTGFTQERRIQRGPGKAAGQRQWAVELVDLNTILDDYCLLGAENADRPAETDFQRVSWLLTTVLNTTGLVSAGVLPNTNTVNMDAADYRGRYPRDVLAECAEKAQKNYFLYDHGLGRRLFYDKATGTALQSTAKISDVPADVDGTTVFASLGPPELAKSPDRVYSRLRFKYKNGVVRLTNTTTETNFRRRDKSIIDLSVKTATKATEKATAFLNGPAATEKSTVSQVKIRVDNNHVNDIRAGQAVQIKLTRYGVAAFTFYRVLRRTVVPAGGGDAPSDVKYEITLDLLDDIMPSIFNTQRSGDGVTGIWEEKSNATEDNATVIIDRGGINVTNGSITVTNSGGTVIIDGQSDIFRIATTGTLIVPSQTTKGEVYKTVDINTGIVGNPMSMWAKARDAYREPLPVTDVNLAGQVVNYFGGQARDMGGGITRVRGFKDSFAPPLTSYTYRYYVLEQVAF